MAKNDRPITVRMDDDLELQLLRLADADGRGLSEYIRFVLSRHVYGHCGRQLDAAEDNGSGESHRETRIRALADRERKRTQRPQEDE